jgi:ribosome-associated protein
MTEKDPTTPETAPTAAEPGPEPTMPDASEAWLLAERAAWRLLEKNAEHVVVLDLRGRSDVCDFFVLASGQSETQVKALARHLRDTLLDEGVKAKGLEGLDGGRWALLDFFDVVVHVFHVRTREYFQLERLWGDAPRLDLEPAWFAAHGARDRHPDLNFATAAGPGGPERG